MPLYLVDRTALDHDDSTTCTAVTPPESVATDLPDDRDPSSDAEPDCIPNDNDPSIDAKSDSLPVPSPGSTFIIRSLSSGQVLTLLDGQITLTHPNTRGSIDWACVETKGWLGFRNTVSGKFLGHDAKGRLCCSAERHQKWEFFCFRMRREGGCVLLMTHYERLWHVGVMVEEGVEKLAKVGEGGGDGVAWEFIEVS